MIIKNVKLTNFRNYLCQEINFVSGLNMVYGRNAQGKTNLVESLYILSTIKSFRNSKLLDCINENANCAIIEAEVLYEGNFVKKLKLKINKEGENEFFVNENKITQKKDYFGFLYAVIFSPDELKLVKGSPDIRREFLDTDICQVSKVYADLIERYEIILQSRNKLLKFAKNSTSLNTQLDVWEDQMSVIGSQITVARQNFVEKLNIKADEIMKCISEGKESLRIEYVGIEGKSREEKTEKFSYLLRKSREKDLELGFTTVGPHRDDIKFYVNDKEVKPFASQGQQRSVVLALKLAELETLAGEKEKPILILDDVFSELDSKRQKFLLEYLVGQQVFVTSTTAKAKNIPELKKLLVKDGIVK